MSAEGGGRGRQAGKNAVASRVKREQVPQVVLVDDSRRAGVLQPAPSAAPKERCDSG